MPNQADDQARKRQIIQQAIKIKNAAAASEGGQGRAVKVTLGNVDLPCYVSNGRIYLQAPLAHIYDAFGAELSYFFSDLEIRISEARSPALPRSRIRSAAHRSRLAKSRVVRGGRKQ